MSELSTLPENVLFEVANNWNLPTLEETCLANKVLNSRLCQNSTYWRQRFLDKFGNIEDTQPANLVNWIEVGKDLEKKLNLLAQTAPTDSAKYLARPITSDPSLSQIIYRRYIDDRKKDIPFEQTLPVRLFKSRKSQLISNLQQNWRDLPVIINGFDTESINQVAQRGFPNLSRAELVGLSIILAEGGVH